MTQTVTGPQALNQRPEDVAAANRRKLVQNVFEQNLTKNSLMGEMTRYNVSVTELAQAMDYKIDAIAYMRTMGIPDGFQGLKVWPQSELNEYYTWHAKTPNALNISVGAPPMSIVQAVMDREFSNNQINPAHKIPWKE